MTKATLFRFVLALIFFAQTASYGQKVKYKDIFGLLSTKQYEQAEPFLKKYLKTNDDNPNAYLFMGMVFHEKAMKMDVLKQTALAIASMDSAIIFYDKAYATITEKEIRRDKEYYQPYNRRDLRTGEFGIKLSDIQFDLEQRKKTLKERIDKVKMAKHFFVAADTSYKQCNETYRRLQKQFPGDHELYLRADESVIKDLTTLVHKFDTCIQSFENYKNVIGQLGQTGYKQVLTLSEIKDLKTDGGSPIDFHTDNVSVWDYKKFAAKGMQIIEKEIVPMRAHLIQYDIEINKLRERLNNDSVSVRNDLTKLINDLLFEELKRYDTDPLPMDIFAMKTADLEYRSSLIDHKNLRDSANVLFQLSLLNEEIKSLNKLDSITSKIVNSDLEKRSTDYAHFVNNTFSNSIVMNSYIKALHEYAIREKRLKDEELLSVNKALDWIVEANDSIPLKIEVTNMRYKPLLVEAESFTVGLSYKDSLTADGYFYSITPGRNAGVKFKFPVIKAPFRQSRFNKAKALTYSDPSGQLYYVLIYSENAEKQKYPATLTKIYKTDGVAWTNNLGLNFIPAQIEFKPETSELSIADLTNNVLTIDKNGKVLK